MKSVLYGVLFGMLATAPVAAQDTPTPSANVPADAVAEAVQTLQILDATGIDPDDFLWDRRIVAVLAASPRDPAFIRQMEDIRAQQADLLERDVVVLFDADRNSGSLLRQMLRPRGFMLAIIEKDGQIKQRRPSPRDVREISAAIDHFPLRRQEFLERNPAGR